MGRKYANPPVEEAICEFRLTPETRWDLTVSGLLYERLKQTFPQKEQLTIQERELTQGAHGLQEQIRTSERLRFFSEDRTRLAQVGLRMVAVNALKPYPGWAGFKPKIEIAWRSLQEIVPVEGFERIGLRYINRVELDGPNVQLNEYLDFYPFLGPRLPQRFVSFLAGVEFSYADDRDRCRLQLAPVPILGKEGKAVFMLDLDYFLIRPRGVAVEDALAWVEEAHSRVEDVFEGCITDKLREMFEEVK